MSETGVQRRLAAILAADVVGYSRLMGQDEARTLTAVKKLRAEVIEPCLSEHQGRLFKSMGDGFLVEFPSIVNAVACAVAIQKTMATRNADLPEDRAIKLRIGVNLGDVIVEGDDIFGDGVNVAARLEGLAPPGGTVVSASAHDQIGNRLDLSFEDLGDQTFKNIAKPIRVYRLANRTRPVTQVAMAGGTNPSIAVLPFTNMSGDAEQDYFSDGITEDIITELSRFRNLLVIARNTSFMYKGSAVDVKQVGRDLGVSYVLEGSLRKSGNRVRIASQLIDAETGNHIWADRFDRELADVFSVQDEITRKMVSLLTLGLEDDAFNRAQRKPPESLLAYDYWLRGKRLLSVVDRSYLEARRNFENAIRIDPKYSCAYSGLSDSWMMEALDYPLAAEAVRAHAKAFEAAQQAFALDGADYQAHIAIAWTLLYRHDYERMKRHIDLALDLNPNDADTLVNGVYLLTLYGDPERAISLGETAVRLNPRHPDWYISFLAGALFMARRFSEALDVALKAPDHFVELRFGCAAILAHMGRLDEARQWVKQGVSCIKDRPGISEVPGKGLIELLLQNNPYRRRQDRELYEHGLRIAGVPDWVQPQLCSSYLKNSWRHEFDGLLARCLQSMAGSANC